MKFNHPITTPMKLLGRPSLVVTTSERPISKSKTYQVWLVVIGMIICLGPVPTVERLAIVHTNLLTMCSIVLLMGVAPLYLLRWLGKNQKKKHQENTKENSRSLKEGPTTRVNWQQAIPIGIIEIGMFSYLYMLSITMGNAGKASVLVTSTTLWAGLLGWWFLKERVNVSGLIGMALVAFGLLLVLTVPDTAGRQGLTLEVGASICGLLAGLAQALGALLTRKIQLKNHTNPMDLVAKAVLAGGIVVTVITIGTGNWVWPTGTMTWVWLGVAGILGTAGGWATVTWLFVHLPNYVAAMLLLFAPVSCSLIALSIGSSLNTMGWVGLGILIAGAGCGSVATKIALKKKGSKPFNRNIGDGEIGEL